MQGSIITFGIDGIVKISFSVGLNNSRIIKKIEMSNSNYL